MEKKFGNRKLHQVRLSCAVGLILLSPDGQFDLIILLALEKSAAEHESKNPRDPDLELRQHRLAVVHERRFFAAYTHRGGFRSVAAWLRLEGERYHVINQLRLSEQIRV
jgi:hypothetical protein